MPEVALIPSWEFPHCVAIEETCYHGGVGCQVEADCVVAILECNTEDSLLAAMGAARYDAVAAAGGVVV